MALGQRLEELERPAAKKRREATQAKAGNKLASKEAEENGASNLDEPKSRGRTDEKVADAVGMKKDTYRKAKAVVLAAGQPDAPPEGSLGGGKLPPPSITMSYGLDGFVASASARSGFNA